jgi:hypothetical protein
MLEAVRRMISDEVGRLARSAVRRIAFLVIGLVFATLALVFGGIALFLWFATMMAPALAGLAVAGVALLLALIALLMAGRSGSPPPPPPRLAEAGEEDRRMAQAEALGKLIGRDLKGFPMVVVALAVGMIAGRMRR